MAAVTAAVALIFSNVWLVIPGGILYALCVYSAGPARLRRAKQAEEMGLDLRDAPPGLKRWQAVLRDSLAHIQADLQRVDSRQASLLRPVGSEVAALGADIRRLIRQAYSMHSYLQRTNTAFISARIEHLNSQIENTSDAFSKQQLKEAVAALQRQLQNCEQIRVLIGRTEATLENMQASLQSIGSSVVKLSAGDMTEATLAREDSLARLSSARSTVSSLEEVLQRVELA